MPFSKVEPFLAKISSKKIESVFNPWKVILFGIIGCFSVALIVGVVFIIIFAAGFYTFSFYIQMIIMSLKKFRYIIVLI